MGYGKKDNYIVNLFQYLAVLEIGECLNGTNLIVFEAEFQTPTLILAT